MNRKAIRISCLLLALAFLPGCWGDPELHKVSGKVTLKGKSYNRLIVYFRPMEGKVNKFNMGVGETDPKGNMTIRATKDLGLAEGKYRVSFSCIVDKYSKKLEGTATDEKDDDNPNAKKIELVAPPYDEATSSDKSPVEFEVKAGENVFNFDIPKAAKH